MTKHRRWWAVTARHLVVIFSSLVALAGLCAGQGDDVLSSRPLAVVIAEDVQPFLSQSSLEAWLAQLRAEGWVPQLASFATRSGEQPVAVLERLKRTLYGSVIAGERTGRPVRGVVLVGRFPQPAGDYGNPTDLWLMTRNPAVRLAEQGTWSKVTTQIPPYAEQTPPDFWISRIESPSELATERAQGQWLSAYLDKNLAARSLLGSAAETPLALATGYPNCDGLLVCTPRNSACPVATRPGKAAGDALLSAYSQALQRMNTTTLADWYQHYQSRCSTLWPEVNPVSLNFYVLWRLTSLLEGREPRGSSGAELVILPPEFFLVAGLSVVVTVAETGVALWYWYRAGTTGRLLLPVLAATSGMALMAVPYHCHPRRKFTDAPFLPMLQGDGTLPVQSLISRQP